MCVCGWQLVALAVFIPVLTIGYDEIEGRRAAKPIGSRARSQSKGCRA